MATPTTSLQAINSMIINCGETPVSSLDDGIVSVAQAKEILAQVLTDFLTSGWSFNTEKGFLITPSYPDGEIVLPTNCLGVDTTGDDKETNLVQRGNRLYDPENQTYTIGRSITVDLVLGLNFEDLPQAARAYVLAKASRQFQERTLGSAAASDQNRRDEMSAWADFSRTEARTKDLNLLKSSWSVGRVLAR